MKKRFLLVLIALLCLVTFVAAIPAIAEGTPGTTIMGHNLELNSSVSIVYYVDFQNAPAGAETGVLVWTDPQESYTYGEEDAKLESIGINYGYETFSFTGVSSKMMAQDIYAVSYIKKGDDITYSALDKYSVLQYAYNKKGDTTKIGGTKTLGQLLEGMLDYGALAQQYFNYRTGRLADSTYYQISVVNGTLPDTTTKGLYQEGESVTLTATVENLDHWENKAGETVGTESTLVATVGTAEETYTAVAIRYSEGLEFTSNGDGTCYVSGIGTCTDADVRIPPVSPERDVVTAIGNSAFWSCSSITSVRIPSSVTNVRDRAFYHCIALTNIEIPDSVTNIGWQTFNGCYALANIEIPCSVTSIGNEAFCNCHALTSLTVSAGNQVYHSAGNCIIETATGTLIAGCNNSLIPDDGSVTAIGAYAFSGCNTLTSIEIPNSVTSIGDRAFYDCGALDNIEIPDSVTSIGVGTLTWCASLASITVSAGNQVYHSAGNCIIETATGVLIAGCKNSLIPADGSVTSIEDFVFFECIYLSSITIPSGVTSIGDSAFSYCPLTSVTLPNGFTSIGPFAFCRCYSLTSINLPNSLTEIKNSAFLYCTHLTSIFYDGTMEQWNTINKEYWWDDDTGSYVIHCTDGDIAK